MDELAPAAHVCMTPRELRAAALGALEESPLRGLRQALSVALGKVVTQMSAAAEANGGAVELRPLLELLRPGVDLPLEAVEAYLALLVALLRDRGAGVELHGAGEEGAVSRERVWSMAEEVPAGLLERLRQAYEVALRDRPATPEEPGEAPPMARRLSQTADAGAVSTVPRPRGGRPLQVRSWHAAALLLACLAGVCGRFAYQENQRQQRALRATQPDRVALSAVVPLRSARYSGDDVYATLEDDRFGRLSGLEQARAARRLLQLLPRRIRSVYLTGGAGVYRVERKGAQVSVTKMRDAALAASP